MKTGRVLCFIAFPTLVGLWLGRLWLRGRPSRLKIPSSPVERHKRLVTDKRVFVIGDIHGCVDEFKLLLKKADVDLRTTVVVLAGDLVNKGPDSVATLRYSRQIGALAVRGNHEEAVLRCVRTYYSSNKESLPIKRYRWITGLRDDDVRWLARLPFTISIPSMNAIVVHAGLIPNLPLEEQSAETMVSARNVVTASDGTMRSTTSISEGLPIGFVWPGPELVCFGHDAKRRLQRHDFSIGLDTGCVYGDRLTGIYLDDLTKVYQVEAGKVYEKPASERQQRRV
mmetsp:Transcript_12663/g.51172  ORF Transcript_12663/g.51172 Transcript_12663/m.51172 type:complete len:283 (-) Transcript_12663:390-1238(-)